MPLPEALQVQVSYQRLLEAMTALSRHLATNRHDSRWQEELGRLLETFCQRLTAHYRLLDLENDLGEVEHLAPHLHDRLQQLQKEQRLILREAADMQGSFAPQRAGRPYALADRIRTLLKWIEDHENRKNRLVMEAYYSEAGVMD
jgi:hypothetical protein